MNRVAVGTFAIAYVASAGKSASTESEAQYQGRKPCVAEPVTGICKQIVPVDRKAYKETIALKARSYRLATRSRKNAKINLVIS